MMLQWSVSQSISRPQRTTKSPGPSRSHEPDSDLGSQPSREVEGSLTKQSSNETVQSARTEASGCSASSSGGQVSGTHTKPAVEPTGADSASLSALGETGGSVTPIRLMASAESTRERWSLTLASPAHVHALVLRRPYPTPRRWL